MSRISSSIALGMLLSLAPMSWADDLSAVRQVGDQAMACEQQLVGQHQTMIQDLNTYRQRYDDAQGCRYLVQTALDSEQPYIDMGNTDREELGTRIDDYPLARIQARLQLCLSTVQTIADYLSQIDAAGCNF